jgi:hypothetical protein
MKNEKLALEEQIIRMAIENRQMKVAEEQEDDYNIRILIGLLDYRKSSMGETSNSWEIKATTLLDFLKHQTGFEKLTANSLTRRLQFLGLIRNRLQDTRRPTLNGSRVIFYIISNERLEEAKLRFLENDNEESSAPAVDQVSEDSSPSDDIIAHTEPI